MAETIEVANAYIALTVKAPGIKRDIENELGKVDGDKAGRGIGSKLMTGVGATALVGAAAVGAAVVGTLGVALTKGFQRLNAIDQATAKMEGLGFSAEQTQGLMDNALASVKGTAFGLGEAAGVAAQLATTGIGPGEEMASLLGTIANSAAAAGGSMDEMGSIFAKAATQANGVQNDVLQQLADRGIPIYQKLGEQLGVTAGEVFNLASAGQIGFDQFAAAAEAASGGVAAAMSGTVQGSFDNLMASLGRIGAGLLGGVFGEIAPLLQNITASLAPLEASASQFGKTIGEIVNVIKVGFTGELMEEDSFLPLSMVQRLMDFGEFLRTTFDAIGPLIGQVLELSSALSPMGLAFEVLAPLLPLIGETFADMAGIIGGALGQVLVALLPVLAQVVNVIAQLVGQLLPPLMPMFTQLAGVVAEVLLAVLPLIEPLMQLVEAIFPILSLVIAALIPVIGGVVDAIGTILIPIVETLVTILGGVIEFLTGVFTGDWEKAWGGIVTIFEGIWNGLGDIFMGVLNGVIDLINGFLGSLNEVGNFVSDVTGGAISFEVGKIPHLADGATIMPRAGGTLAVLAEAGRPESVVDTGLMNRALEEGLAGRGGNGNGPLVAVYPSTGMDEFTVGAVAARKVDEMLRAG